MAFGRAGVNRLARLSGVVGLVAVLVTAVIGAAPAQAYFNTADNPNELRNVAVNSCLDDDSEGLDGFACDGSINQVWQLNFETNGNNPFELINRATGGCLDDSPQFKLRVTGCNGWWGGYQAWTRVEYYIPGTGTVYEFRNNATGLCLEDNPSIGPRTFPCNGGWGGYQLWRVTRR